MTSKTPFELRFDLLSMASDYLNRMQDMQQTYAQIAFDAAQKMGTVTEKEIKALTPPTYTIKDIIDKAQELYGCVEKK